MRYADIVQNIAKFINDDVYNENNELKEEIKKLKATIETMYTLEEVIRGVQCEFCDDDENLTELLKPLRLCLVCNKVCCYSCSDCCGYCRNDYCSNCTFKCDFCDDDYCKDCIFTCLNCYRRGCNNCSLKLKYCLYLRECSDCYDSFCDECVSATESACKKCRNNYPMEIKEIN